MLPMPAHQSDNLVPGVILLILSAALLTTSLFYSYSVNSVTTLNGDTPSPNSLPRIGEKLPRTRNIIRSSIFSHTINDHIRTPTVNTSGGLVSGLVRENLGRKISSFQGIPYGGPTNGRWRFKHPRPAKPWFGVLFADKFGPSCFQMKDTDERFGVFPGSANLLDTGDEDMSEDCLFLNIWTPVDLDTPNLRSLREKLKPVMVFIHGGDFLSGTASHPAYDGAILSSLGDVVVVTFNYRVGALGWLALYTEEAPGNQALFDQLLALNWIKANIGNFGGDSERVTLFGHNGGAIAIGAFMVTNRAQGLFQRAIMQSGSVALSSVLYSDTGLNDAERFAQLTGCYQGSDLTGPGVLESLEDDEELRHDKLLDKSDSIARCLKKLKVSKILKTERTMVLDEGRLMAFLPRTNTDDNLVPRNIYGAMRNETAWNKSVKEILIGTIKDEGGLFIKNLPRKFGSSFPSQLTNETAADYIKNILSWVPWPGAVFASNYVFNGSVPANGTLKEIMDTLGAVTSTCPIQFFGEQFGSFEPSRSVYYYHVSFTSEPGARWPQLNRVAQASSLMHVFGQPLRDPHLFEGSDIDLAREMIQVWSSFAKTGKPIAPRKLKGHGSPMPWPKLVDGSPMSWPKFNSSHPDVIQMSPVKYELRREAPLHEKCNRLRITLEI